MWSSRLFWKLFLIYGGFNFALTYWDTTIDDLYGVDSDDADARVVFSVSKSL